MAKQFLSQAEIDALLDGPSSPATDSKASSGAGKSSEPKPYDLSRKEKISRGRMPTLELIHERFSRGIRVALFNFMRRSPEISLAPLKITKYSDFVSNIVVPTSMNIMQASGLHGNVLFILEPRLIFTVVEIIFGGGSQFMARIEGREFSTTEQRIIMRLLELVNAEYMKAWASVFPLTLTYLRSEMHPQFANFATPSDSVVSQSFDVDLGDAGGAVIVCLPYSMLEPVREALSSPLNANAPETDRHWKNILVQEVQPATVELSAELAHLDLTIGDILSLQQGDILPLDLGPHATIRADRVPIIEGKYGVSNGRYAVRVDHLHSLELLRKD